MKNILKLGLFTLIIVSCGNTKRVKRNEDVTKMLKKGNNVGAIEIVKSEDAYFKKDRLAYYMDNGILNFYTGNYKSSFQFLEKADRYQENLYTQSATANIGSFLINDNQKPYKGEDYELLYINVFKALDFLVKDNLDDALVEVRRGINKTKLFETRYRKEMTKARESMKKNNIGELEFDKNHKVGKYNFSESVLLRLISLLAHRDDGQDDEAEIDKRKINELWEVYSNLYDFEKPNLDSIKLVKRRRDEKIPLDIIAFSGLTAIKKAWELDVFLMRNVLVVRSKGSTEDLFALPFKGNVGSFSISIPYVERIENNIAKAVLYINNKKYTELKIIENTSNIAINQYEKKKKLIILKSLLRSTIKAVATYKLNEKGNNSSDVNTQAIFKLAGLVSGILSSASEQADIRNWNTLPDNFYFDEVLLPKGKYDIEIHYKCSSNHIVKKTTHKVVLDGKKKTNLILSYGL